MNTANYTKVRLMAILKTISAKEVTIQEVLEVVNRIEELLKGHENTPFKIGKTGDCNRRDNEYDSKGYLIFEVVFSHPSLDAIDEMEKCLVRYFKIEETTKNDIVNVNDGGAGKKSKSLMYYIYVTFKTNNNENN